MAKAEGAATFPYMKDPNTGVSMTESDDIVVGRCRLTLSNLR
jgi:hypothetical protein